MVVDLTATASGLPDLTIQGFVAGQLVTSVQMSCDPSRDRLALVLDDASINGDGTDATRFTIRALDAYGNQRPNPSGDVTLTLAGPATLVAENPFAFALYGGVGGGFIQSQPGTAGQVTLTAAHPTLGLTSAELTIVPSTPSTPASTAVAAPAAPARTTPQPAPVPPVTTAIASALAIHRALEAALSPTRSQRRIRELLRQHGYRFTFDAPATGVLIIDWYWTPHPASRTHRPELVATARATIRRLGRTEVKLRLTPRGRSLLAHATHERVTISGRFTPAGQDATRASRTVTLTG